ncbi:MAG: undecaprenyl-phosphate alpha-N-acetylglucosaminyl 1-phosphate transferase [Phycisphaerales bacterium]|nr:MAG: undecaprenyl-phosphate alpha-N-acetylglucosaminyl 1-phosphate transferase [Phycisphaerales bacterium]
MSLWLAWLSTDASADAQPLATTGLAIFHRYIWVFVAAFAVTIVATPIVRRVALASGIIDRPSDPRKVHRVPVAYLGGLAVFLGIMAGTLVSYLGTAWGGLARVYPSEHMVDGEYHAVVPVSVLLGMTIITIVGLLDDAIGIRPGLKISGQLVAAAALAIENVGVRVAQGVLRPVGDALVGLGVLGSSDLVFAIPIPGLEAPIHLDVVYWAGAAVIAVFVIGACNAANLIDGLDGLLTGSTAITVAGLTILALSLAVMDHGPRDAQRLVLCLAVLGACMGFLPHNFNPASIFLGDCGSMLLGYSTIVIILTLGDMGQTHLVLAGLMMFAVPIIDAVLAIVRRRMAGTSITQADDQHLHHMLKRALGVKGAVLAIYGITACFVALGLAMSLSRARVVYALAMIVVCYVGVTAIKISRRQHLEHQASRAGRLPDPALDPAGGGARTEPTERRSASATPAEGPPPRPAQHAPPATPAERSAS